MKIAALSNRLSSTSKRAISTPLRCLPLLLWGILLPVATGAETFTATAEGKTFPIQVTPHTVMGETYYSLNEMAAQFGETVTLSATKANVRISGFTASLAINGNRVSTREGDFSLVLPIVRQGNVVFIANADTPMLFSKAFHVQLQSAPPKTPVKQGFQILEPTLETTALDPPVIAEPATSPTIATPPPEPEISLPPPVAPPAEITTAPGTSDQALPKIRLDGKVDTIIIDPGHGGEDSGYMASNGIMEKDITLVFGALLRQSLKENTPIKPLITRREDTRVSLVDRIKMAEDGRADFLVSLQCGGAFAPHAKGVNIYYPLGKDDRNRLSKLAAEIVAAEIEAAMPEQKGSVHAVPLALFHHSPLPGILIEIGYLSNPDELSLLQEEAYQQQLSETLANGLTKAAEVLTKEAS